jgi:hypothetical protein
MHEHTHSDSKSLKNRMYSVHFEKKSPYERKSGLDCSSEADSGAASHELSALLEAALVSI